MGLWGFQNPDHRVLATWSLTPRGQETPLCRALGAEQQGAPRSRRAASRPGQEGGLGRPGEGAGWRDFAREPEPERNTSFPGPSGHRGHFVQVCPGRWVRGLLLKEARLPAPLTGWISRSRLWGRAQQHPGCWGARQGRLVWGRLAAGAWPPGAQCCPPGGPGGGLSHPSCLSSFSAVRLLQGGPSASGRVVSLARGCWGRTRADEGLRLPSRVSQCPGLGGPHPCVRRTEGRSGAWARTWRLGPARALTLTGNCQAAGVGGSPLWVFVPGAGASVTPQPHLCSTRSLAARACVPSPALASLSQSVRATRGEITSRSACREALSPTVLSAPGVGDSPRGRLLLQLGISAPGSCSGIEVRASPAGNSFPMMSQNKLAC